MAVIPLLLMALVPILIVLAPKELPSEDVTPGNWKQFIDSLFASVPAADYRGMEQKLLKTQATLETGWGKEANLNAHKNLFNIHAEGPRTDYWDGASKIWSEGDRAYLRQYKSFKDSLYDHIRLISESQRYRQAYLLAQQGSIEYFTALESAGYAQAGYGGALKRQYQELYG